MLHLFFEACEHNIFLLTIKEASQASNKLAAAAISDYSRLELLRFRNSPIPRSTNPSATTSRSPTPHPAAPATKDRAASAINARPMQMYHQANKRTRAIIAVHHKRMLRGQ
jgi:hypothetical protein